MVPSRIVVIFCLHGSLHRLGALLMALFMDVVLLCMDLFMLFFEALFMDLVLLGR